MGVREVSIYELLSPLLLIERNTKLVFKSVCLLDNNTHLFIKKKIFLRLKYIYKYFYKKHF